MKVAAKTSLFYFILFACCFLIQPTGYSQSKEELAKKKEEIEKEIQYTNRLIEDTKKNRKESLDLLVVINKKISLRQQFIAAINREISRIDKEITELSAIVDALENDIKRIKEEYAKMLLFAYKNRSASTRLMFIFSAKDFQQSYNRARYLQQYSLLRKKQAELIIKTQQELNEKIKVLEVKKNEKRELLRSEENEKKQLSKDKNDQLDVYESLKTKEVSLKEDLKKKQSEAVKLQKAIEEIIAEELRKAREAAKGKTSFELTPEAAELSASFSKNKGKLPWPVERGIITDHFGQHEHPVLKGIMINNNGIDITTDNDAQARAVFNGEVSGVVVLPGQQKAVIIQHGEYFSVYGNLKEVFVKKGDKVTVKQPVGTVLAGENSSRSESHLEIWKMKKDGSGTTKLNPEEWLFGNK